MKIQFCENSRRWLIDAVDPKSCPWLGFQGTVNCIGEECEYWKEREAPFEIVERVGALQFERLREDGRVQVLDPELAPRVARGVDYGAAGHVLLRHGDRSLVWRPGHDVWAGRGFSPSYVRAAVSVLSLDSLLGERVLEGRFSCRGLVRMVDEIRRLLQVSEEVPLEAILCYLSKDRTIALKKEGG